MGTQFMVCVVEMDLFPLKKGKKVRIDMSVFHHHLQDVHDFGKSFSLLVGSILGRQRLKYVRQGQD